MNVQDYLWYPYLRYQAKCKEQGKEDSIQEWLELTGRVKPWKPPTKKTRKKATPKPKAKAKPKTKSVVEKAVEKVKEAVKPKRSRNGKGQYVKDDPKTVKNEAWEGGDSPPVKPKRKSRKRVSK